jgi:hypothetical protein
MGEPETASGAALAVEVDAAPEGPAAAGA